ncbi:hypothetical protein HS99_0022460 [Kitasatospora aureofaciens]|uniref:Peptidase S8/S53 domain-containing protein n=1 Tax=Kitasatospora aureofaciens TaxID=1894 RepID=A0A1E7NC83_KITAU|nr:hypothetical protein HS99_0022460 [Kitasatospora aureofaciens]
MSGTSDATAYVSATAALIRSKYPNLSAGQVINRMIKSATPPANGTVVPNNHYGYGTVSPAKALDPNPAVDNGPKDNPLAKRPESKGTPHIDEDSDATDQPSVAPEAASGSGGGSDDTGQVIAAVAAGAVVLGASVAAVVTARRRKRAAAAVPPYGGPGQ